MLSGGGGSNNKSGSSPTPAVELPLLSTIQSLPKEIRNLLAGGIAGMIAKSFVAPIDRIKILYQVTSAQFRLRDVPKVAYSIIETEGTAALWKGNTATMIRVFPYSGIQFILVGKVADMSPTCRQVVTLSSIYCRHAKSADIRVSCHCRRP